MIMEGIRDDGWSNILSGLGKRGTDKTESTNFCEEYILQDEELSSLYNGEGLGANIVDAVPDDMTRAGWTIDNDEDEKIAKELDRLKATTKLNEALKYARLYRGALVVLATERGKLEEPMPANPGKIKFLRVYSAARVNLNTTHINDDPDSIYFEDVEVFDIQKRNGTILNVHRSRCLWFGGEMSSDYNDLDFEYRYWGLSIFQRIYPRLKHYGATERGIANLMMEINIGKYTLSNLATLLSQNSNEGVKKIYDRIEIINASKSIINAVLLGEGESYERDTANLSGIADIIDRQMINVSAVSRIAVTRLWGTSAAGMNATGVGDIRNYYDDVSTQQENKLKPELQILVDIIGKEEYGTSNKEYAVTFNSLWEPTEKERAEIDKLNADTHKSDIDMQVITEEESRAMRYSELPSYESIEFGEPEPEPEPKEEEETKPEPAEPEEE